MRKHLKRVSSHQRQRLYRQRRRMSLQYKRLNQRRRLSQWVITFQPIMHETD